MKLEVQRYETGAIGLPTKAIIVTNSERTTAMCPRRWWFARIEGLRSETKSYHRFGTAWHAMLEDIHEWWMVHDSEYTHDGLTCIWCDVGGESGLDCKYCEGSGLGPIKQYEAEITQAVDRDGWPIFDGEEVGSEIDRICYTLEGWFHQYGRKPYAAFKVVGVEIAAARVITGPTGKPYCPVTYLVREPNGDLRLAGTGEVSGAIQPTGDIVKVQWPYYQISRFDCVLQHRTTDVLYLGEWKTSKGPQGLVDALNVDPQTDGYMWVLESIRGTTEIPHGELGGYLYDVSSSTAQHPPKVLKPQKVKLLDADGNPYKVKGRWAYKVDANGTPVEVDVISTAKSSATPSWLFREQIAKLGLDYSDYREHVKTLEQTVDPKLYIRTFGTAGPDARQRYSEEIYAVAVQLSTARRRAARAKTQTDLNHAFPRVPVCRLPGGMCAYRGPCLQDGDDARDKYERTQSQVWRAT